MQYNQIGADMTQLILKGLEINKNFFGVWIRRSLFLTFIFQLFHFPPPDNVEIVNVRRVLELEEMKREIMNFL